MLGYGAISFLITIYIFRAPNPTYNLYIFNCILPYWLVTKLLLLLLAVSKAPVCKLINRDFYKLIYSVKLATSNQP